MSSQISGVIAFAATFYFTGGNVAASSAAYTLAAGIDSAVNPPKISTQGPRLGDTQRQASEYGGPIPRLYGTARMAGNVEYLSDRREVTTQTQSRQGKGGPKVTTTNFSYYVDAVISFVDCPDQPITGIRRIWANGKLIYTNAADAGADSVIASTNIASAIRFKTGTETELPDPLLEAVYGVGNVPGFRGVACIVFEDFLLDDFYGVLPQIECEVVKAGAVEASLTFGETFLAVRDPEVNVFSFTRIVPDSVATVVFREGARPPVEGTSFPKRIDSYRISQVGGGLQASSVATPFATFNFTALAGIADIDAICVRDWDPVTFADNNRRNVVFGPDGALLKAFVMGPIPAFGQTSSCWAKYGDRVLIAGDSNQIHAETGSPAGNYARLFDWESQGQIAETDIAPSATSFNFVALTPTYAWLVWTDSAPSTQLRILNAQTGAYVGDFTCPARLDALGDWRVQANENDTLTILTRDGVNPGAGNFLMATLRPDGTAVILAAETTSGFLTGNFFGLSQRSRSIRANGLTAISVQVPVPGSPFGMGMRQWVFRFEAIDSTGVTLAEVVEAECGLVGLTPSDIDTSELTDIVGGYPLTRNGGVRGGLEPLQRAFYFDIVESAGLLKFPKRGRAVSLAIPYADLGAGEGQAQAEPLQATRSPDLELPLQVAVNYINPAADYQVGTEIARRLTTPGRSSLSLEIPVVMTADQAAACAEAAMYEAHASRTVRRISLDRRYAALEPADVVNITDRSGNLIRSRIVALEYAGPVLSLDTVEDDANVWTQTVAGAAGTITQAAIALAPPTLPLFLDIPILQDSDDDFGMYVKLQPLVEEGWRGAVLYRILDDGDRVEIGTVLNVPTMGLTSSVLAAPVGFGLFDEANSVEVSIVTGDPESFTHETVLNGLQGAWLIGSEVVQAQTATFVSGSTWRLSGLIRGVRGTEWAATTHVIGERAVQLDSAGMLRVSLAEEDIGQPINYAVVSIGRSVGTSPDISFTNTAIGKKPFAPVNLRGARSAGDWTLTWDRRSRLRYANPATGDIPLGEASQLYDVVVYASASPVAAVVRTIAGVTAATATYTAAQQTTDFGSTQATVHIGVFQLSASVGRGYVLRSSLTG